MWYCASNMQKSYASTIFIIVIVGIIALIYYSNQIKTNLEEDALQDGKSNGVITASYSYPYPVFWSEQGAKFSLTAVSWSRSIFNSTLSNLDLYFKITTGDSTQCIEIPLRRVVNEEGDLDKPKTSQLSFGSSSKVDRNCPESNTTYVAKKFFEFIKIYVQCIRTQEGKIFFLDHILRLSIPNNSKFPRIFKP